MTPEEHALPTALSVDGRRFTYDVPVSTLDVQVGGYVVIEPDRAGERLGQVTAVALAEAGPRPRSARVEGVLLDASAETFAEAATRLATPEEVARWLDAARPPRAVLEVGELSSAPGVPLALDAGAFDRHTFLCGQSGSGKTYALGTILERLLAETSLRLVILDPNSDFVRLAELRDDAGDDGAPATPPRPGRDRGAERRDAGPDRLHVRFRDFDADGAGGGAPPRPDRRPRGVRGAGRSARDRRP